MDLRTGLPVWLSDAPPIPIETRVMVEDERCRVAIVGGGITGSLLADRLSALMIDTVVLDSREFAAGSTAASTSLLLPETDTNLVDLAERMGNDDARRVFELGHGAVDSCERLAASLPDECGFARRPSVYFASGDEHVPVLRRESDLRKALGFECELVKRAALKARGYSLPAPAAILSEGGGEIDAYRFSRALLARAARQGARAYTGVRVVSREMSNVTPSRPVASVELRTSTGHAVRADCVVYATGYEAHEQLRGDLGTLATTWVFASEAVGSMEGWPNRAMLWEASRPYAYMRTLPGNRVLMGGADEEEALAHADEGRLRVKAMELASRFATLFPAITLERIHAWAGVFGSSTDGLPYIGRPDPREPVSYALGYGGNGITFSVIASDLLCAMVQGQDAPDARLFRFDR